LGGDSAVWVLIDSGDEEKDQQAEATIRKELAELEKALELPPQELMESEQEWQPDTQVELRIGFSLVRLKRDDPQERVFLSMLLNSEPDLADFEEPIAIPIFGRGRTFFALVGKGINAENVQDNCYFICGDCSCQIKEQNPGMDMVMAVNWDAHIMGTAFRDIELPELTGVGGLEIVDLEPLETPETANADPGPADAADIVSAVDTAAANDESVAATETATTDIQLAQADVRTSPDASPAPASETAPEMQRPASDGASSENTLGQGPLDEATASAAPAEIAGRFSTRLLVWILGGAALAAAVILSSSYWMRSRQGV
jgi:hypothetical protein